MSPTVKERLGTHPLDHLSHLWQTFWKGEERYQTAGAIRVVRFSPERESTCFFPVSKPYQNRI